MYQDFLNSDDEYFFNADSDLLFSNNWLANALSILPHTDGILSLFNTPTHPTINSTEKLCEKNSLGAAGTLFTWDRVKEICDAIHPDLEEYKNAKFEIDWTWSRYFRANGVKLFCTKASLVQHIGIWGENAQAGSFDFGLDFKIDSIFNGQVMNDLIAELLSLKWIRIPPSIYKIFPFKKIKENSKIVLYGAGHIGQYYYKLIRESGYCHIVAWVDKNPADCRDVSSPKKLQRLHYDYILLATSKPTIAASMREDIAAIDPSLCSKIVTNDFE